MDYLTVKGLIPTVSLTLFRSGGVVIERGWNGSTVGGKVTTWCTVDGVGKRIAVEEHNLIIVDFDSSKFGTN
jgi:hypothetical protein